MPALRKRKIQQSSSSTVIQTTYGVEKRKRDEHPLATGTTPVSVSPLVMGNGHFFFSIFWVLTKMKMPQEILEIPLDPLKQTSFRTFFYLRLKHHVHITQPIKILTMVRARSKAFPRLSGLLAVQIIGDNYRRD